MKYITAIFLIAYVHNLFPATTNKFFNEAQTTLRNIIVNGDNNLYISGHAWHNRYKYTRRKIQTYNENAWGGGIGRSVTVKNNEHNLYAFAFLDSHYKVEPIAGYGYFKTYSLKNNYYVGLGGTVFLTSRVDIFNTIPFPGALPLVSFKAKKLTIMATYIPGAHGNGNVLFAFGRISI